MNKKLVMGFLATYVVMNLLNMVIHMWLLKGAYMSEAMMNVMRPESDGMMWVYFVTTLFIAFFFTLIYSKGHEGKGIAEGVRYGFYVGMMMAVPMAYDSYASYPIPYSVALQWFFYGLIQYVILGVVVSMVYGKKQ